MQLSISNLLPFVHVYSTCCCVPVLTQHTTSRVFTVLARTTPASVWCATGLAELRHTRFSLGVVVSLVP